MALLSGHDQGQTRVSKTIACQDRDLGHFLLDLPVFHTLAMHLFWLPLLIYLVIETPTRVMVEGLKRFGLVQINSAHMMKDMIGLDAIDHLELTNKRGESVQISKPIL